MYWDLIHQSLWTFGRLGAGLVGKVNVEEQPDLAQKYGINAIPTLLLFKGGEVVERFQGVPPRSKLEAALDSVKA